jgi:thymidylate synthase (FAD)
MPMVFYTPDKLDQQSTTNKQGRENGAQHKYDEYIDRMENHRDGVGELYTDMLSENFARELCRIELPLSTYTYWYWHCDLRNLLHFLKLRCDAHAQAEIRAYANIIAGMVKMAFPHVFAAWYEYIFTSQRFTSLEWTVINNANECNMNLKESAEQKIHNKREQEEFLKKVHSLNSVESISAQFNLDLTAAKTPEYFSRIIEAHGIEKGAT